MAKSYNPFKNLFEVRRSGLEEDLLAAYYYEEEFKVPLNSRGDKIQVVDLTPSQLDVLMENEDYGFSVWGREI